MNIFDKNKKRIIYISLASALILGGCTFDKIPDMTEEEQALVCEYAADILLAHNKYADDNVLSQEEMDELLSKKEREYQVKAEVKASKEAEKLAKEAKENEKKKEGESGKEAYSGPVYEDIDRFLELNGLSIEYKGYSVMDSYPESISDNDWQGVCRPTGDNKLLVFSFDITNESGEDYYLDMASLDTRFSFKINNTISKNVLTTLLNNDFIMYRDTIPAGATVTNVMILELKPEDAAAVESVVLKMKYNGVIKESLLEGNIN